MIRTFHTYVDWHPALPEMAKLYCEVERAIYVDIVKNGNDLDTINSRKQQFLPHYDISARFFNGARIQVQGKIDGLREAIKQYIEANEARIKALEKKIDKIENPKPKKQPKKQPKAKKSKSQAQQSVAQPPAKSKLSKKTKFNLHQHKRRLENLKAKNVNFQKQLDAPAPSICFGGKKLFKSQFLTEEPSNNGKQLTEKQIKEKDAREEEEFAKWKKKWQFARSDEIFLVGSKDEKQGNQLCQATIDDQGDIDLQVRLPNALQHHGKYIHLKSIKFHHGAGAIRAAIAAHASGKGGAINYRFMNDGTGWRVYVTINQPFAKKYGQLKKGALGVDFNRDCITVTVVDRHGNPIKFLRIPTPCDGKTAEQREAMYGDACKIIVDMAVSHDVPIIIEYLDFQKKKAALEVHESKKYARMLSSLAYSQIGKMIRSRATRLGVELVEVNPAYSSVIGDIKFSARFGVSTHQSAALVIARRGMVFSERLPRSPSIVLGDGSRVTLRRPVDGRRHVWRSWGRLRYGNRAAFETRLALAKSQSLAARTKSRPRAASGTCPATSVPLVR